ncbi:MAG: hypothetical protein KatS3mg009_0215 [Acidimicrobiia bacterium]|nr:MAG: hypothetical protein KatS3mg009_0215 [Acidimicrobiia bacterium]
MRRLALALVVPALVALAACDPQDVSTIARKHDPVVLTGAGLPSLAGASPERIVAYSYNRFVDPPWRQVPVQVDERHTVDLQDVHAGTSAGSLPVLAYSDPSTLTGADPDATFDADDELVFMAGDAFGQARGPGAGAPPGTVGAGVEVTVEDPLRPGERAWLYLFRSDGSLDPGAGRDYVEYSFDLLAGDYPDDYDFDGRPDPVGNPPSAPAPPANPEDSRVRSAHYELHFLDRWITDVLRIRSRGASGVDILDRNRNHFAPGVCGRSEQTFAAGHGAFVTNKDGPVRAIRDYVGANSGTYTQRRHVFYAQREDVTTFLRVHSLAEGPDDLLDLSPAASGMRYRSDVAPGGVTVDGVPDAVTAGALAWELYEGPQGSLVVAHSTDTDLTLAATSRYVDDTTPSPLPCTGSDAQEWGAAGSVLTGALPNTDPLRGAAARLVFTRTHYFAPPGLTTADAAARAAGSRTPFAVSVDAPWPAP